MGWKFLSPSVLKSAKTHKKDGAEQNHQSKKIFRLGKSGQENRDGKIKEKLTSLALKKMLKRKFESKRKSNISFH